MALVPVICPSLLACDFARLGEEAKGVLEDGADWLQYEVV
jgi:ribulose-phosphate 3-epimerase